MEDFNQIESNILNKIKNVSDRNSLDSIKTEIFGKKGIITDKYLNDFIFLEVLYFFFRVI